MARILLLSTLALGAFAGTFGVIKFLQRESAPLGMVWIPGGEFTMGSNDPDVSPAERPAHRVRVDGFWMDETDVTNAQFRRFVEATGYVTTAEKTPTLEEWLKYARPGQRRPTKEELVAGSIVFTPPDHPVPLDNEQLWQRYVHGANWRHPEGPDSSIEGMDDYPVVHVS